MQPERYSYGNEYEHETVVACRLAREAGDAILRLSPRDVVVRLKGYDGPVTGADWKASELILAGLSRTFPEDLAISEEGPTDPNGPVPSRVWYVDPLDGTRESSPETASMP